jgi:2-C-methyl-D-erythritol 4-phosphate cytidylyltransferase
MRSDPKSPPDPGNVVALVPAAGSGTRLGLGPKAFLKLNGESLVQRSVRLLANAVGRILVAVPRPGIDRARRELGPAAEVHPGGATRAETVRLLFSRCTERLVVVHDPTHPFVTRDLLSRVIDSALRNGAAMAFTHLAKPCARWADGVATGSTPGRNTGCHQSPQAFHREILERALRAAGDSASEAQATWEVVARIGVPVHTVPGDESNIKITTRLDWEIARRVIMREDPSGAAR